MKIKMGFEIFLSKGDPTMNFDTNDCERIHKIGNEIETNQGSY